MPIILLLLLAPFTIFAAVKPLTISLNHPQTALSISWNGKVLEATDRHMKQTIESKPCNQKLLQSFLGSEEEVWRNIPAEKPLPIQVKRNDKTFLVSSRSELGGYLLSLSDKVRFLTALSDKACKTQKKKK